MRRYDGKGLGKNPKQRYVLAEFDSVRDLVDHADMNTAQEVCNESRATWGGDFFLTESYADARELAIHGWHDIRPTVDAHLEPIREKLADVLGVTTERYHDLIGAEPDIDRYLAGELECMWEDMVLEAPKEGRVFTLLVDATMTYGNTASDIAKRGAVLCGLVEAAIILGFQLEVWTELTIRSHDAKTMGTVLTHVSRAGEPLDIDSLMFAIGHPDYNRRIMWSWGETDPVFRQELGFRSGGNYGLCRNGAHMTDRVGASITVSLDGNTELTRDPVNWILDQLEAQGVYESPDF